MTTGRQRIAVLGAGIMGHGIAQAFAQKGYRVELYDVNQDVLDKAFDNIRFNLETFAAAGAMDKNAIEAHLGRIKFQARLDRAVASADFVIEAAPEDMEVKKELFTAVAERVPSHAILASNTSMLPISNFGAGVRQQENLVITHWFNPPHIIPVVEVVAGPATSEKTLSATVALLDRIGKTPVKVAREIPGFLVNRIQAAMFREVLSLLEDGMASPEDLDSAIKGSFGLRLGVIGVLETMDMAGLDLMLKGMSYLYPHIDGSVQANRILQQKVARGHLGAKSGQGFFSYTDETGGQSGRSRIRNRDLLLLERIAKEASA